MALLRTTVLTPQYKSYCCGVFHTSALLTVKLCAGLTPANIGWRQSRWVREGEEQMRGGANLLLFTMAISGVM